jgi:hypothetical protein
VVKYTTVSLSFNVEISDSFCGYGRSLHLDLAIWTTALTHWFHFRFNCLLVNILVVYLYSQIVINFVLCRIYNNSCLNRKLIC